MSRIHIKDGHLIDPAIGLDEKQDLFIDGSTIVARGKKPDGFEADDIIDASGLTVIPGIIDLCARLREPGSEHVTDIKSETTAAVRSGITHLCLPPDTDPIIDDPSVIELINHKVANADKCKVSVLGAMTIGLDGNHLAEMNTLKLAGCVGVSNCRKPIDNSLILKRAFSYATNCGLRVFIEPDDHHLSNNGNAHEGPVATRLGLSGIPVSAETSAIAKALEIISETHTKAHFGRLSTAKSVTMIRRAKEDGLDITADVSAHQLHLTEMDISSFNNSCNVLPPLRSQRDRDALRQGVADGTIDAICSDHQPQDLDAKRNPFSSTQPGISSLETFLPLTLKLVEDGVFDMNTLVRALSSNPAKILGNGSGNLKEGSLADLCLIDTGLSWTLEAHTMSSRGKNSPFIGWNFDGRAVISIVDGKIDSSNS